MRFLVTGGSGMLGSSIVEQIMHFEHSFDLFDRSTVSYGYDEKIKRTLEEYDVIIHAAANTNAEECEKFPEECFRDNTLLTEKLAYESAKTNCKFVFISSTGIYGKHEKSRPYTEYDKTEPTTVHHRSKLMAESAVKAWCTNHLIIRTGWIFGGHPSNPKNFVARRIEEALSESEFIESNIDQRGSPSWSVDVARAILLLVMSDQIGVFNVVNQGCATRYDYVKQILNSAGIKKEVRPVKSSKFKRLADVSNNESAECLKLRQLHFDLLPDWTESLDIYIKKELRPWFSSKVGSP